VALGCTVGLSVGLADGTTVGAAVGANVIGTFGIAALQPPEPTHALDSQTRYPGQSSLMVHGFSMSSG